MKMTMKMIIFFVSLFLFFFTASFLPKASLASTPFGDACMFVAYLDGTVSLINDTETQDVIWSVKTGNPICESYQASPNLNSYIYCQPHDWNLYKHDRRTGTVKRVNTDGNIGNEMHEYVGFGVQVRTEIGSSGTVVDAHTGHRFKKPVGIDDVKRVFMREKFYIRRVDYVLAVKTRKHSHTIMDDDTIWNVRVADFTVQSLCPVEASPSCENRFMPFQRVHIADSHV